MLRTALIGYLRPSRCCFMPRLWVWLCLSAVPGLLFGIGSLIGPQPKPTEYDVKAAYLFNFGKFLRFDSIAPQQRGSTFDICILGRDPIGHTLDQIAANESIDRRPVRVLRVADVTDGRRCQVLFISAYEADNIREDLAILSGADVLTVSDAPGFLDQGGMIQFVLESDHVRFAVNLDAVSRTHLVLSSELLRVAASIKGKPEAPR